MTKTAPSRKTTLKSLFLGFFAASGFALTAAPASASIAFTASGTNAETGHAGQSAQANISLVGSMLTLTLKNTSGLTQTQGDALTGILFNIANQHAELSLQSISLASGSNLWVSGTSTNDSKSLAGSWTDELADHPRLAASYGLATTGFNGEFKAGEIETGNASSDYGIVGAETLPGVFRSAKYPVVDDALTFKIKVSGTLAESDISNVRFLLGTDGRGVIQGSLVPVDDSVPGGGGHVPEPASFALLGVALAAASLARRRTARVTVGV